MPSVSAIPIQLQATTRSTPPIAPIDLNTGDWPAIWKGSDVVFNTGIFDAAGFSVNLSNLDSLTLQIFPYVPPMNYLGYPQVQAGTNIVDGNLYVPGLAWPVQAVSYPALVTSTVLAAGITPTITYAQWNAALTQNAAFQIADTDTAAIDLQGQPFNRFIIAISGKLSSVNSRIIYASGPIFIYESGITLS